MTTTHHGLAATPILTPDLFLLRGRPEATALIGPDRSMTYAELAEEVSAEALRLGPQRGVVVLEARNDVPTVVRYLAALAAHHPVLLVGADAGTRCDEMVQTYRGAADLHPDLAVLLSTSGSTGSPKVVRLSRENVAANAASIAEYLAIRPDDRAVTSLPLHYCYGLSVLTSHLWAGASVVLTDGSVADECFWDLVRRERVSSLAGVPFTFDLLDASGFAERDVPSLRYVTQAGGRMPPDQVRRYSELGQARGWDLFVMYGQTEATARMAFLPPALVARHPETIGVPVPGGAFDLVAAQGHDLEGTGVGELVYRGPNVMMGYAHQPADLARGPELTELRTGDLARLTPEGLWQIIGRLNRQAKVFGLRVDLERLEQQADPGCRIIADGDALHVFTTAARRTQPLRAKVVSASGLPPSAVHVHRLEVVPTTSAGKTDYTALLHHLRAMTTAASTAGPAPVTPEGVRDLYAVLLGRPDAKLDDSFVSLGGDSLSFVEVSARLGRLLGGLPTRWHERSITELAGAGTTRRRLSAPVEMSALLRGLAILMVLVTHVDLAQVAGGAHVLLAVVGFNLARFGGAVVGHRARVRRLLRSAALVALPAVIWIGTIAVVSGQYRPATVLLLNGSLGGDQWTDQWHFWFLEAAVWSTVAIALALAVGPISRWQREQRFAAPVVVLVGAVALRWCTTGIETSETERYSTLLVLWCVAAGWAAAEARTTAQRATVVALATIGSLGFFGDVQRELIVVAGIALLLWGRPVSVPRAVASAVRVVGGASLWIYLTHWQVYPPLEDAGYPVAALVVSIALGVAAWWVYGRVEIAVRKLFQSQAGRSSASTIR